MRTAHDNAGCGPHLIMQNLELPGPAFRFCASGGDPPGCFGGLDDTARVLGAGFLLLALIDFSAVTSSSTEVCLRCWTAAADAVHQHARARMRSETGDATTTLVAKVSVDDYFRFTIWSRALSCYTTSVSRR